MLKTFETKPQLIVNVGENGEFPALCHNMTCDFSYITPVGEITDFTWTAGTKELVLVGTSFPAQADITSIEFAQSTCTISAISATSITCTLDHQETCGIWQPKLNARLGLIPLAAGFTKEETIDCTITSVAPTVDLNILGYDNLTFTGTNFPRTIEGNSISISIVDGTQVEKATCVV